MSKILYFTSIIILVLMLCACRKQVQLTSISIKDANRHYYPAIQGQSVDMVFQITNTGKYPLIIREVQATCGCIKVTNKSRIIVPEKGTEYLQVSYNSTKNIGLVAHTIWLYGNIEPQGNAEIRFDLNIVPNADYTRDYEELFREYNIKNGIVNEMVDGKESEHGYYVGNP